MNEIFKYLMSSTPGSFQLFKKPAKLPEMVTDSLLGLILGGTYPESTRLPSETDLSKQFGVSRTVIREAVTRLKSQGIVESRQGSGVFVRSTTAEDALRITPSSVNTVEKYIHVMEMRRALDTEISALAAGRINEDGIVELKVRLTAIDTAVAQGKDSMEADIAFHRAIVVATANPYLMELWNFVSRVHIFKKSVASSIASRTCGAAFRQQITQEHTAIYAAIEARDPEKARMAASRHIDNAIKRIMSQR